MAAKEKTLSDAFYETLKDVYWAEKQGTRSLGKAAKAAKDPALRKVFETHREESAHQIERLEQVFEIVGKTARAKTCEAMKGISEEMTEDLEDFGDTAAADAVLVGCAQAVEHYEIARYGTLKAWDAYWAKQLGFAEAEKLLGETLEEEKRPTSAQRSRRARRQRGRRRRPDRGRGRRGGRGRGGRGRAGGLRAGREAQGRGQARQEGRGQE